MHRHPFSRIALATLAIVALLAAGCSTTRPVGTQLSDSGITSKIKTKLAADPEVNPFNIDVDTLDGVVTLNGRVKTEAARTEAEKHARQTNGVREVINRIEVVGS